MADVIESYEGNNTMTKEELYELYKGVIPSYGVTTDHAAVLQEHATILSNVMRDLTARFGQVSQSLLSIQNEIEEYKSFRAQLQK